MPELMTMIQSETKNTDNSLNVATSATSDTDAAHPKNASIEDKFDRFFINHLYFYNIFCGSYV